MASRWSRTTHGNPVVRPSRPRLYDLRAGKPFPLDAEHRRCADAIVRGRPARWTGTGAARPAGFPAGEGRMTAFNLPLWRGSTLSLPRIGWWCWSESPRPAPRNPRFAMIAGCDGHNISASVQWSHMASISSLLIRGRFHRPYYASHHPVRQDARQGRCHGEVPSPEPQSPHRSGIDCAARPSSLANSWARGFRIRRFICPTQ